MSSTKNFKTRMAQLANGRDAEALLGAMVYVANNQPLGGVVLGFNAAAAIFRVTSPGLAVAAGLLQKVVNGPFPALTGLNMTAGQKVQIAFYVDATGTLGLAWGNVSLAVIGCTFPDIPTNVALLGCALLETSGVFTGGTTNLDAGTVTITFGQYIGALSPVSYF